MGTDIRIGYGCVIVYRFEYLHDRKPALHPLREIAILEHVPPSGIMLNHHFGPYYFRFMIAGQKYLHLNDQFIGGTINMGIQRLGIQRPHRNTGERIDFNFLKNASLGG